MISQTKKLSTGMFLVSVIPISRGIGKEELSYFTSIKLSPGSLVTVPLRFRKVPAVVVRTEDAVKEKASLRSRSYTIKKLEGVTAQEFLSPVFFEVVAQLRDYYSTTTGAVLDQLVPKAVLDSESKAQTKNLNSGLFQEILLQNTSEKRLGHYTEIITKNIADGRSVFIVAPTIGRAKILYKQISRTTENLFLLHSKLTKKQTLETWTKAVETKHPAVMIGTGSFLSIPRNDLGTFIVDNERSRNYKTQSRPFIDVRTVVRMLAEKTGASCIYADTLPRTETFYRYKQKEISAYTHLQTEYPQKEPEIVDMRGDRNKKQKALLFSPKLTKLVEEKLSQKEPLFLFVARRGLAPISVCDDCGMTQQCTRCSAPVTLHTKNKKRVFVCHHCGRSRKVEDACEYCGSWKLTTLGIGTELVQQKMKEQFPSMNVLRADSDTTKTDSSLKKILGDWRKTPNTLLVGTELLIPHILKTDTTAVVSLDSLFALPDFRINERVFGLLVEISSMSKSLALIQTRNPNHKVLEFVQKNTLELEAFYENELEERKKFGYPPFVTLIKLTAAGSRALNILEEVRNKVKTYNLDIFPAFRRVVRGKEIFNALITLPRDTWPEKKLLKILRALPPEIAIDVDPQNVL